MTINNVNNSFSNFSSSIGSNQEEVSKKQKTGVGRSVDHSSIPEEKVVKRKNGHPNKDAYLPNHNESEEKNNNVSSDEMSDVVAFDYSNDDDFDLNSYFENNCSNSEIIFNNAKRSPHLESPSSNVLLNQAEAGSLKFLPSSILNHVISDYLDVEDCSCLSRVSKLYNKLADKNAIFTTSSFLKSSNGKKRHWEERFSRTVSPNSVEEHVENRKKINQMQETFFSAQESFNLLPKKDRKLISFLKNTPFRQGSNNNNSQIKNQLALPCVGQLLIVENKDVLVKRPELLQFTSENFRKDPNNRSVLLHYVYKVKKGIIPDLTDQLIPEEFKNEVFELVDRFLEATKDGVIDADNYFFSVFPGLKSDKQLLLFISSFGSFVLTDDFVKQLDPSRKNDEEIWDALISCDNDITLREAPAHIRANRKIGLKMLERAHAHRDRLGENFAKSIIENMDKSLWQFSDIISASLRAVNGNVNMIYPLIDKNLLADRRYALKLVKMGDFLRYFPESFRKDPEIVFEAFSQNPAALEFAHENLKDDPKFIVRLINQIKNGDKVNRVQFLYLVTARCLRNEMVLRAMVDCVEHLTKLEHYSNSLVDIEHLFYVLNEVSLRSNEIRFKLYSLLFSFCEKTNSSVFNYFLDKKECQNDALFIEYLLELIKSSPVKSENLPKEYYKNSKVSSLLFELFESGILNKSFMNSMLNHMDDFMHCFLNPEKPAKRFLSELTDHLKASKDHYPSFISDLVKISSALSEHPMIFKIPNFLSQVPENFLKNHSFLPLVLKHVHFYEDVQTRNLSAYPIGPNYTFAQGNYITEVSRITLERYRHAILSIYDEMPDLLDNVPYGVKNHPHIRAKVQERAQRIATEAVSQQQRRALKVDLPVTSMFD